MKIELRVADGGYIIAVEDEGAIVEYVAKDFRDALYLITDLCGEGGSRHDENRLYIVRAPGDKHASFTEVHSEVLFPKWEGCCCE